MTDAQDSLEALAVSAAQGDQQALEELLAEIQPRVRRICGRMLLYPEDAEEAAQDALLLVSTRIHTFAGRSRFTTWLHAVASNSARSTYRRMKNQAIPADPQSHGALERPDPRTTSVIAGSKLDLLEALDVLGEHNPDLVDPVVLRDVNGLDYNEIATLLDVPLGTVKSRIHTARQILRPLLAVRDQ